MVEMSARVLHDAANSWFNRDFDLAPKYAGYGGLSRLQAGREIMLTNLLFGFFLVGHDESISK